MRVYKDNGCRTCSHIHYWEVNSWEVNECANPSCKCKAEDWMPFDNLEYLEALTDKRNLNI